MSTSTLNNPKLLIEVSSEITTTDKVPSKDEHGYYPNVPLAVLDHVSLNKTMYDSESMIKSISDPGSALYHRLTNGLLTGEFDHPDMTGLDKDEKLTRFMQIKPEQEAIHFKSLHVREVPNVGKVVFGSIKGHGPWGNEFEKKMEDPNVNCAFSLRAITDTVRRNNYLFKKVKHLVTFDTCMAGGGFGEAVKSNITKYTQSQEGLDFYSEFVNNRIWSEDVTYDEIILHADENLSQETKITYYDVNEIFGIKNIIQSEKVIGVVDRKGNVITDEDQVPKSLFKSMMNNK